MTKAFEKFVGEVPKSTSIAEIMAEFQRAINECTDEHKEKDTREVVFEISVKEMPKDVV